nr:MAG TPA: hypothetical protein [Crassvirales sp.]
MNLSKVICCSVELLNNFFCPCSFILMELHGQLFSLNKHNH